MLEAKIEKKVLKEAIETIVAVTDEARLQITNGGFSLKAVDAASVAFCDFSLQKDAFVQYSIDEPRTVGMDFAKLLDMISVGGKEEVELKMDGIDKLKIKNGSLSYALSLPNVDILRKEPNIPELEFPTKVEVGTEDLKRAIRAAKELGDAIVFGVEEDKFYIEAENEMDKMRMQLTKEQLVSLVAGEQPVISKFSTDYLSDIAKGFGVIESVKIGLGKDHPLSIGFEIAEGLGKVEYLVAPRIDTE
ncbi:DNA polymerase sliding clamp [candidate division WOR-3 bacterium]|nr:DNA polymerase sliding clamp [candidate division WOR-3 bacterium]